MASEFPQIREAVAARSRMGVGVGARVGALAIALVCLMGLALAARLRPESAGHGTHMQLGLPACGWAAYFGKPCATCGMTTAWAWAAHGRYGESFLAQPMGMILCLGAAMVFWGGMHAAVTASRMGWIVGRLMR